MNQPTGSEPIYVNALLYLDEFVHAVANDVDVDKLMVTIADAFRDDTVVEVDIMTGDGKATKALVKPANARIAFVHKGPFTLRPQFPAVNEIGKPG